MWCLSHCVCGSRLLQQRGPNIRGLREGRPNANFRSQSNDTFSWVIQKQCYASAEWPPRSSALLITAVQLSPFPTLPPTPPPPTLGTEMPLVCWDFHRQRTGPRLPWKGVLIPGKFQTSGMAGGTRQAGLGLSGDGWAFLGILVRLGVVFKQCGK